MYSTDTCIIDSRHSLPHLVVARFVVVDFGLSAQVNMAGGVSTRRSFDGIQRPGECILSLGCSIVVVRGMIKFYFYFAAESFASQALCVLYASENVIDFFVHSLYAVCSLQTSDWMARV